LIIVLVRKDAAQQSLKLLGCRPPEGDHSREPRPVPLKASGLVRWKTLKLVIARTGDRS